MVNNYVTVIKFLMECYLADIIIKRNRVFSLYRKTSRLSTGFYFFRGFV